MCLENYYKRNYKLLLEKNHPTSLNHGKLSKFTYGMQKNRFFYRTNWLSETKLSNKHNERAKYASTLDKFE